MKQRPVSPEEGRAMAGERFTIRLHHPNRMRIGALFNLFVQFIRSFRSSNSFG